jgi:1-acyl-sn-glycerol-3-phosphate acyltransferase
VGVRPVPAPPPLVRRSARALLAIFGWRVEIALPPVAKCVIVFYPHTSNWDFAIGYLAKLASGLPAHWMGKDSLFRWPVAGLLRRMGGIPVIRVEDADYSQNRCLYLVHAHEGRDPGSR